LHFFSVLLWPGQAAIRVDFSFLLLRVFLKTIAVVLFGLPEGRGFRP
jgi:hypothetical protein